MRGADAWAGTIKSGGKTRRAAKMVVLDVDHPDIHDFIWCKAREEEKAAPSATPDSTCGSTATASPRSNTRTPTTRSGSPTSSCGPSRPARLGPHCPHDREPARDGAGPRAVRQIADAAWRCADPGIQYDTTINRWHTCPESGRINASNPCSRVHARRRLGLQPRLDQPDEVPQRGRHLRRRPSSRTPSTSSSWRRRSSSARRAIRPRRSATTLARSASSASATPTSARC